MVNLKIIIKYLKRELILMHLFLLKDINNLKHIFTIAISRSIKYFLFTLFLRVLQEQSLYFYIPFNQITILKQKSIVVTLVSCIFFF